MLVHRATFGKEVREVGAYPAYRRVFRRVTLEVRAGEGRKPIAAEDGGDTREVGARDVEEACPVHLRVNAETFRAAEAAASLHELQEHGIESVLGRGRDRAQEPRLQLTQWQHAPPRA